MVEVVIVGASVVVVMEASVVVVVVVARPSVVVVEEAVNVWTVYINPVRFFWVHATGGNSKSK